MVKRRPARGQSSSPPAAAATRWLVLIHQIPPKPDYFRVKIWRRLQRLGAVAIKNSVYALPRSEQAQEDLQWVLREVVNGGGEASICEARFVDGLADEQVEALFRTAREDDYAELVAEARKVAAELGALGAPSAEQKAERDSKLLRLKRRLGEIVAVDFFDAPGRQTAEGLLKELEERQAEPAPRSEEPPTLDRKTLVGRRWVTRKAVFVDRIASAWLVRRFIDPNAVFKFVDPEGYRPRAGELRFDMFDAEFTHEGDRCTFEVLLERLALDSAGLRAVAEIVHDIDLKDGKFGRPETAGVQSLLAGIAMKYRDDRIRLERGFAIFDDLLEFFSRRTRAAPVKRGGRA